MTRKNELYLEYGRETLRHVRRWLSDEERQRGISDGRYHIEVDSVELEDRDEGKAVVVIFRAEERPGCRFGFEMDAVEPLDENDRRMFPDPREWAAVVMVNLDETLSAVHLGLPEECVPDSVTWV
jgi:hypothetical protein